MVFTCLPRVSRDQYANHILIWLHIIALQYIPLFSLIYILLTHHFFKVNKKSILRQKKKNFYSKCQINEDIKSNLVFTILFRTSATDHQTSSATAS